MSIFCQANGNFPEGQMAGRFCFLYKSKELKESINANVKGQTSNYVKGDRKAQYFPL